jgi:DNA-binding NarL/FixJ family response regulator
MIRVLIADDHTMVREGLRRALERSELQVVGEASNGEEAVQLAIQHRPDVVLMDLSLPVLSGAGATKRIRKEIPGAAVLVLSMLSDETAILAALAAGASGYLVKDCTTRELVDGIVRISKGERVFAPSLVSFGDEVAVMKNGNSAGVHPAPLITKREEDVLRTVATGISLPQAAAQLYISVKTLKNHLSSIYQKLDCHDRAQAVLKALRLGLIQL